MRSLSGLLEGEGDFVTVTGHWLKGRREFREWHDLLHSTMFKHSTFTVLGTTAKFIRRDVALTHVKWRIEGDFSEDGTPRQPRKGIFTQVLVKKKGRWLILASHNTNFGKASVKALEATLGSREWK